MSQWLTDEFIKQTKDKIEVDRKPAKGNRLVRAVNNRKDRNKDSKILFCGEAGIGKSWASLRFGELHDTRWVEEPENAVKEQLFFKAVEYLDAVTSQDPKRQLIYDEPGQSWYHRQFMSGANIILNKTMIGNRFLRFVTVLNLPFLKLLDSDARAMAQYFVWIEKTGHAEVYRILPQKFGGDPWYKCIIDDLKFGLPSTRLIDCYEKRKAEVQTDLYQEYKKELRRQETPVQTTADLIDEVKANPGRFLKGDLLHVPLLCGELGIGRNRAEAVKAKVEADMFKKSR